MTKQKIGIFAGTFDPIHDGHVAFAEAAYHQSDLDKVVFLPELQPRRKLDVTSISKRLYQIRNRISHIDYLEVQFVDQASFSVADTLPAIKLLYPNSEFALLIGSDVVEHLGSWADFDAIGRTMRILVGLRLGCDKSLISTELDRLEVDYDFIETAYSHLASSQLRAAGA